MYSASKVLISCRAAGKRARNSSYGPCAPPASCAPGMRLHRTNKFKLFSPCRHRCCLPRSLIATEDAAGPKLLQGSANLQTACGLEWIRLVGRLEPVVSIVVMNPFRAWAPVQYLLCALLPHCPRPGDRGRFHFCTLTYLYASSGARSLEHLPSKEQA